MFTTRLDLASAMRRAHTTAWIALSCATAAFPAVARADDASDKGSSSASSSSSSSSDDSKKDEGKREDDARLQSALDEALLPSFDMVTLTGAPAGQSVNFNQSQHRGRAGLFGAIASGALLATQFRASDNMSTTASALTSPASNAPGLGNVNDPIVNPEPGTVALLASGLGVIAFFGNRRRRSGRVA